MENTLTDFLKQITEQLDNAETTEAIEALKVLDEKFALKMGGEITLQSSRNKVNERERAMLSTDEYRRFLAQINDALIRIIKEIPKKAERNAALNQLIGLKINDASGDGSRLEKIIGGTSTLLKINWLEKASKAARAVCKIARTDGEVGTGWLLPGGYLMTNNHVLPTKEKAAIASAQFNFETDAAGQVKNLVAYSFDTSDFLTNADLDFTRIKIKDRPDQPIAKWGHLEIDPEAVPVKGEAVTIIQHPQGEDKQIALNANEVLGQKSTHLYYSTDTLGGSSGSPVFNKNWKVVALHHAGGKFDYDNSGIPKEANRGVLFKHISPLLR